MTDAFRQLLNEQRQERQRAEARREADKADRSEEYEAFFAPVWALIQVLHTSHVQFPGSYVVSAKQYQCNNPGRQIVKLRVDALNYIVVKLVCIDGELHYDCAVSDDSLPVLITPDFDKVSKWLAAMVARYEVNAPPAAGVPSSDALQRSRRTRSIDLNEES